MYWCLARQGGAHYIGLMSQNAINLLKTAAGLQELEQLIERQAPNLFDFNGKKATYAYTRYVPKRGSEILDSGGSIYWILKNRIQARQRIMGFELVEDPSEHDWCKIIVDPQPVLTYSVQKRAIQGWRYLEGAGVPKDKGAYGGEDRAEEPPPEMMYELKRLGLL